MRSPPGTWRCFNSPEIWPTSNQSFNSTLSWLPPHLTKNHHPPTTAYYRFDGKGFFFFLFQIEVGGGGGSGGREQKGRQKMWAEMCSTRVHHTLGINTALCVFALLCVYFGVLIPIIVAFAWMTHCFNAAVFNIAIIQTIVGSAKLQMSADVRHLSTRSHTRWHPVIWARTHDPNPY